MDALLEREPYLDMLTRWRDRDVIKVVTGARRCGKSTLFELFRRRLRAEGVPAERIIALNLEDLSLAPLVADFHALHEHIAARLVPDGPNYVFIDEIQLVDGFERAIDSLRLREGVDIYLTGSNATLLSGELATLLSGRAVEISMLPLSFAEFASGMRRAPAPTPGTTPDTSLPGLYSQYVQFGSFPFVQRLIPDTDAVRDYLDGLLNTILFKDVSVRQKVANTAVLRDVVAFLFHNTGNLTSLRRVANTLGSTGRGPSPHTIESYLQGLIDAFILYPARRWDTQGLRHLTGPEKYYVVDPGMRYSLVGYAGGDSGHVLENIVFLELLRRHRNVRIGASPGGEIDFITGEGTDIRYIQVAESVRDQNTLARELKPLLAVNDHYPKYLLTLDAEPPVSHQGIRQYNALDWLLGTDAD